MRQPRRLCHCEAQKLTLIRASLPLPEGNRSCSISPVRENDSCVEAAFVTAVVFLIGVDHPSERSWIYLAFLLTFHVAQAE